eukprot:TCONS_00002981-protein
MTATDKTTILVLFFFHVAFTAIIDVDRDFHDYNDRFTLGSLKEYQYKCNSKGGHKCECYYRGTYFSPEGEQAMCQRDGACPNKHRSTISTYRMGQTITTTLTNQQQSGIQKILFWTLINGREAGTFLDYTSQALQYFKITTDGKLSISGIPTTWGGQVIQIVYTDGSCYFIKIAGSIQYPYDFSKLFPTQPTTQSPTKTTFKTIITKRTSTKTTTTTMKSSPTTFKTDAKTIFTTIPKTSVTTKSPLKSSSLPVTTASHKTSSPPSAGQSESDTTTSLSDNKPLVIALIVTTIIILMLTALLIIVCRKRFHNEKGPEGSINYKGDQAVYVSPTENKCEENPGFYAESQDLRNPLYKSRKVGVNNQPKVETNLYEDYDNPEMYETFETTVYDNEKSGSTGRNVRPVTQVGYDYVDDSIDPKNRLKKVDDSSTVGYATLTNVPENIYADTTQPTVGQNIAHEPVDYKNTEGLVPGYAVLNKMPENIYEETVREETRNDYSLLAGTTPQEAYAALENSKYATLEENRFQQENYETLTSKDKNQKSFSKYVGW